ncbi:hypothetical protein C9J48_10945 [Photobacterium profundum]|uniref:Uncharacterized protein n=1 Tax=Photobacterium profundum 3TCK TaxID=314280 RepID=Q1YWV0_9GAMM|nr:hypothetical protein [Photobacterium profundum]EAS40752.1 hypothetical protein P3TCK_08698 [Photobacterium profundum 3TCK]PSV62472.1 hypothetical protein C9J48_10945 [Photobacterium profundum]
MVFDIPSKDDFFAMGDSLLNSAWDNLVALLKDYDEHLDLVCEADFKEQYFQHSKPKLMSSFTLVQQAVEFYLKGRIAEISPYILIANDGRNWPKNASRSDISFLEFRTIDAQDLVKIHNTFASQKLDDGFNTWFNQMRNERNKIIHSVSSKNQIEPSKLAEVILTAHGYFFGSTNWVESRFNYHIKSPSNSLDFISDNEKEGYRYFEVHEEISIVVNALAPSLVRKFFGFNKKSKAMECNFCEEKFEKIEFYDHGRWRQHLVDTLIQSSESKTKFTCFICNNTLEVFEASCIECRETKINVENGQCVWCRE